MGCVSAPQPDDSGTCPTVASIKTIPFRGDKGIDAAFDRLRFDASCEPVLLESLASLERMEDPRQAPPVESFVVGDAALFILLDRHDISIQQILPAATAAKFSDRGVYAYFDFVLQPSNRMLVVSRAKQLAAMTNPRAR